MTALSVLVVPRAILAAIERAGEAAYPEEACGLLAGRRDGAGMTVTALRASANVAATDRHETFEVDPAVRFALMRELDGTGTTIIGHFHSHPDHPPLPSAQDLEQAYEPELVWVITSVARGKAGPTRAFAVAPDGSDFVAVDIAVEP